MRTASRLRADFELEPHGIALVISLLDATGRLSGVDRDRVLALGHSRGATALLDAAARGASVRAIVASAPIVDARIFDGMRDVLPIDDVAAIDVPVLAVHERGDPRDPLRGDGGGDGAQDGLGDAVAVVIPKEASAAAPYAISLVKNAPHPNAGKLWLNFIMTEMGQALMGTGFGTGENRAIESAQEAISSPLLEDGSVTGARGVIINVTGGPDLSLMEVNEASCVIQEAAHEDANIIFGAVVDPTLTGKVKITVIATGFDRRSGERGLASPPLQTPVDLQSYSAHARESETALEVTVSLSAPRAAAAAAPPQLTVSRRPALDLALPLATPGSQTVGSTDEGGLELSSPLDVPAFLRRQN